MPAETAWWSGRTGFSAEARRNRMTIRLTGIIQPARQKPDDHQEGHHCQPDAAQIPDHTLCLGPSAGHGRNRLATRMDGIIQPARQKKKSNQVNQDRSAGAAETG